jgi:hypothetical protein
MSEYTRAYAEMGFRRKVNSYLQRHQVLRRKLRNKVRAEVQPRG